ncbi:MAG: hypothetical protein AB1521_11525 [Bacteroidota bacterium]
MNFKIAFLFILLNSGFIFSQKETNLEIVNSLIEKSVMGIDSLRLEKSRPIKINLTSPPSFEFLHAKVIDAFSNSGYKLNIDSVKKGIIGYSITGINTAYGEPFRDGLFGDYLTQRTIIYRALINYTENGHVLFSKEMVNENRDTIFVSQINAVENPSLFFTKGEVSEPPVLSNLLEPILVVGTLIVTVILLFTVRGK